MGGKQPSRITSETENALRYVLLGQSLESGICQVAFALKSAVRGLIFEIAFGGRFIGALRAQMRGLLSLEYFIED